MVSYPLWGIISAPWHHIHSAASYPLCNIIYTPRYHICSAASYLLCSIITILEYHIRSTVSYQLHAIISAPQSRAPQSRAQWLKLKHSSTVSLTPLSAHPQFQWYCRVHSAVWLITEERRKKVQYIPKIKAIFLNYHFISIHDMLKTAIHFSQGRH